MRADMLVQVSALGESFGAYGTRKGFLSGVSQKVALQVILVAERFVALGTLQ